jgi:hypothetical protein
MAKNASAVTVSHSLEEAKARHEMKRRGHKHPKPS